MILPDTANILRGTAKTDPYTGEPAESLDWTSPTSTTVRCSIQSRTTLEVNQDRETAISGWIGYFDPFADITNRDRVSWRGVTLTVDGEVAPCLNVQGAVDHFEVPLKRID